MKADRRTVLAGLGGLAAAAAAAGAGTGLLRPSPATAGSLDGADLERGHRLRDGGFPAPTRSEETAILIAGGGIAGLAAGWTLADAGFEDFLLLELEDEIGGNSRGGSNHVSAFPWGAHYLPVANRESRALVRMLRRLGIITGEKDGAPVYDPYQLCADLHDRLLWQGRWQEGLVPRTGVPETESRQIAAFEARMAEFGERVGSDGRPAFAIPMELSSRDADLLALDSQDFASWIAGQGWDSPILLDHVRYCMRDDYGCEPAQVSAWAGIHYYAGRRGWAADGAGDSLLTWPEGNARLVRLMAEQMPGRIRTGRIVHAARRDGEGVIVDSFDVAAGETVRTRARAAILAMPHFIAERVAPREIEPSADHSYAPWLVANVTVDRLPAGRGVPLAWDNVCYSSPSLGYVVATHQSAAMTGASVLTWYMPLSDMEPGLGRRLLVERPAEQWKAVVRDDLLMTNPELEGAIRRIDLWRWAHAMIRPTPGFIWGAARQKAPSPPFFLAHSDQSGLSLFEEAHYRGTLAAEGAMRLLDISHEDQA